MPSGVFLNICASDVIYRKYFFRTKVSGRIRVKNIDLWHCIHSHKLKMCKCKLCGIYSLQIHYGLQLSHIFCCTSHIFMQIEE